MSLRDIASSVKRHPVVQKQVVVQREQPKPRFIDAEQHAAEKRALPIIEAQEDTSRVSSGYSRGTSITGIAKGIESSSSGANFHVSEVSWEKCKCMKKAGDRLFCTKFHALCAKDKCPKKFIEN